MMMDENSRSWYVLYTAPRLERKLMQHLTVAGYKTYCPMQTIYVNWNGKTKEIIVPFFSGCVFVEGDLKDMTYLPPHRHTDKEETYVVLRGSLLTFFYDDLGNVIEKVNLNPSAGVYGVEIPSGTWHSIIALEPGTVIFEIKSGPYKPLPPEDIAPWAPAPSDLEGAAVFMKRMLEV